MLKALNPAPSAKISPMEVVRKEDGFNVVVLQCDGCGSEVPQVRHAGEDWFQMKLEPLSRDLWNRGETMGEFHFCSPDCFRQNVDKLSLLGESDTDSS